MKISFRHNPLVNFGGIYQWDRYEPLINQGEFLGKFADS